MCRTYLWVRLALFIFLVLFITITPDAYTSAESISSHNINLTFNLKAHSIDAIDHIKFHSGGDKIFIAYINTKIVIKSVKGLDGADLLFSVKNDEKEAKKRIVVHLPFPREDNPIPTLTLPHSVSGRELEAEIIIEYTGKFSELPGDIKFSREFLSDKPVTYTGEEITLLDGSSCWYPCTNDSAVFKVTAVTPEGYEIVMEGERLSRKVATGKTVTTWDFPFPSSGIYLVGGRYVINEEKYNDITLYTYLFPEDVSLAATYLDNSKRYLELYNRLLGKYPFKKFAVVENMLSTGFGMPSYTLLGQSVLRLPFMVKTSLGHEIAHNWWGNSVYPDYDSGNWSEGLTTYLADYLYEDMEGRGAAYRNQLLRDYANMVKPSADFPLTKFRNRVVPEDRAIGYGKGAFVFHILTNILGEEKFYEGLRYVIKQRSFKVTSWDNFREAFEKVSGKDLRPFFRQWIENSGAPVIRLGEVTLTHKEDGYTINISIHQKGRTYEMYLPVLVETKDGDMITYHWIKDPISVIELHSPSRPKAVTVDPYYDVFRRLNPEEVPATIGKFMGANKRLLILPSIGKSDTREAYSKIASGVDGVIVKYDKDVSNDDLIMNNIYITGEAYLNISADKLNPELPPEIKIENESISVKGKIYNRKDSVLIITRPNPYNPDSVILFFSGDNPEYIESAGEKMGHYSKYSYLLFFKGEIAEKGVWESETMKKIF